jgi:chromosome segregation protein
LRFDRLKITGFKSFVDATEFRIEPGLTGIVGPNGCGKSNLVEALRWVMGETSFKSLRASTMDDVIFAGSGGRAARNAAEVTLVLDGPSGPPSPGFPPDLVAAANIEITRRIDRTGGSTYRVNGREVRARDVHVLFADAASGARSPSLVRQGQVGEIIAAKPQLRRRILEDAAGVAGLHARRHEAELRLKATEENLARSEDVLAGLDGQAAALARQARQAGRYREVAAAIRRHEAMLAHLGLIGAKIERDEARAARQAGERAVAIAMAAQGEAARAEAIAAAALPKARAEAAAAALAAARLADALDAVAAEEQQMRRDRESLAKRRGEAERDAIRDAQTLQDAMETLQRLAVEEADARRALDDAPEAGALAEEAAAAEAARRDAEAALAEAERAAAEREARAAAARAAQEEARRRAERLAGEEARAAETRREIEGRIEAARAAAAALATGAETGAEALSAAEARLAGAEAALSAARQEAQARRARLAEAEREHGRLDAEARAGRRLLDQGGAGLFPDVLSRVSVEPGFERAIAAALGDALEASLDPAAPRHWTQIPDDAPALPNGLAAHVSAPPALSRALSRIAIATREEAEAGAASLPPGHAYVTIEGDLYRWDGYRARGDAPGAAARRLAERNRLAAIEAALAAARTRREEARAAADAATRTLAGAEGDEARARQDARMARAAGEAAAARRSEAARALADLQARLAMAREAEAGIGALRAAESPPAAEPAAQADASEETAAIIRLRQEVAAAREHAATARADLQAATSRRQALEARLAAVAEDGARWRERAARGEARRGENEARIAALAAEAAALDAAPDDFAQRRNRLRFEIEAAKTSRREADEALDAAEAAHRAADRAAREALAGLAAAREAMVRAEAGAEAAEARVAAAERAIAEAFSAPPAALPTIAGLAAGAKPPPIERVEAALAEARREKDRIGPVNLMAQDELEAAEEARRRLAAERDELLEAVRKLRRGVEAINREGRERLLGAFDTVNGHFARLFSTLFQGGEAELALIESDDPLEAGLEITARPPGKRPQVLTLLSGGEQALTAIALIFAVFLTNPSPVCVLDEIDAPLDDANVERLCDLLDRMARETQTRFLTITHNPITMARMDRLYGVTMAEKGVSQIVSLDLPGAERLIAAE